MTDDRKLCFVVMGFGKKTDFESGRLLDLDATYESIIQPAVKAAGLRCVRADEILHSGVIDAEMYEMLLRADLVIADISTGNVNAIYELGVRHALRPNSTIIMKEEEGKLYFDLDHTSTFRYRHLGEDIGAREAKRAETELHELIVSVIEADRPDSPVYTYLPNLKQPLLSEDDFNELVESVELEQEHLSQIMQRGESAQKKSQHTDAIAAFAEANILKPNDPYIIQQLALATYKSEQPTVLASLVEAQKIISVLDVANSNDPETQGISGAIEKRLWLETGNVANLNNAIMHYRRGYEFRKDYYNGENLATCYMLRSATHTDDDEALYDRMSASKVRTAIISHLSYTIEQSDFEERIDRKWIYATLANCNYGLGNFETGERFESLFRKEDLADWEIATFESEKARIANE